jgi:predicted metal-dependent hydrolase
VKKTDRIAEFVKGLGTSPLSGIDPHLAGYLECFNSGRYYEAHDVLEDLWLRQGRQHPDHSFHKGLIQLAGGFVHLRLHHLHPDHPKHGRRLVPARRLLLLAAENLRSYPPSHLGVDVRRAVSLALQTSAEIGEDEGNPWNPRALPGLPPSFPMDQERR